MASENNKQRPLLQKGLRRSVLYLAVLGASGLAQAQVTGGEESDEGLMEEIVVVRGIRASMAENLNIKYNSDSIVDAITAEDIGKFPDKNVADSLQRVPGIVIGRDGGEGSSVSIRGLDSDLTFTQLNGNFIASSPGEPSRSFDFTLLPAAMVQRVEVYKTSEARLDEGGVGGTIIVHSRKPLEMESGSGVVNVEATYADVTEDYEPNFTGVYSWKTQDETFGVLLGYTSQERTNRTLTGDSSLGASWRWAGSERIDGQKVSRDVDGNLTDSTLFFNPLNDAFGNTVDGAWIPQAPGVEVRDETRKREGIQFTAQWRPTDRMEFALNVFNFTLDQDRTLSQVMMPEWSNNPDFLTNVTLDGSGSVVTGADYTAGASGEEKNLQFPWMLGSFIREESTSDTVDFHFTFEGEAYTAKFVAGRTESEGGPSEQWRAAYKSGAPANFTSSGRPESAADFAGWSLGKRVSFYADPDLIENLHAGVGGENDPGSTDSSFIVSDLEETYLQLDIDFEVDWSIFDMVRTGVKHRKGEVHRETRNTFFLLPEVFDDVMAGNLDPVDIDVVRDGYQWNGGMPVATDVINTRGMDNIPAGFDINIMPTINWDRYRELVVSQFPKLTRREPDFVFDVEEEITAAYLQGDFAFANFRGNLGVRYVRTETDAASSDKIEYFLDQNDDDTGQLLTGDVSIIREEKVISREKTDTQFLPSLNLVWDISDSLVARFAVSKTMSRPPITDLGAQERLNYISEEWAEDRLQFNDNPVEPGWSGTGGNKDLDPFESVQTDLSVEYYYGAGSGVGLALFNKEVDNFVVPLQISSTRDFAGLRDILPEGQITVNPFQTSANGTDATSRGVEVFVQHAFENGFGVHSNFTYNDTNKADVSVDGEKVGESELVGSADTQFNLSVYYENDLFSVRASYNRRGERVLGLTDSIPTFADPYKQIDVNATYNIMENLSLTASVVNLTEEEQFTRLGDDTKARLLSSLYSGRRFYLGLTYNY